MKFSEEQKDYIIHALEHCEVLTGGRSSGKTLELIKQQNKEIERLNRNKKDALEFIERYLQLDLEEFNANSLLNKLKEIITRGDNE